MNDIRRVLRQAAWRVWLMALGRALTAAATVVLAGMILLRIAQQLFLLTLPWQEIAIWSAVGGVLAALLWTIVTRADRAAIARRVDEGADLREALSTALCIEQSDDPWSRAALEAAAERARTVQVRQAVPMQAPRFWPVPLALALSLAVVWIAVQPIDLFGAGAVAQQKEEQQRQMEQARFEVESATQKLEEMISKLDAGLDHEADDAEKPDKPEATTPDEIRRDAIRKLTSLKDRLEEIRSSEKAQALQSLEKQLRQLRTPGEGPLTELANHLARADFSGAAEELQKLMEKLAASNLTPEQKEQLAQQLEKLAEQLQRLANERKELEDALQKAGLDKSLASNPQALKEALEKSENLTQEQKEQLRKMAEAAAQCGGMCQNMGAAMEAMSRGMGESGMDAEGMDAMEALMNELGRLEQMAQELDMADAAAAECQLQLSKLSAFAQCKNPGMGEMAGLGLEGTRPWAPGSSQQQGMGAGGPGRGQGGSPGATEADFTMEKKKVKSPNLGGPIVSQIMIQGEQIRGESRAEFAAAVAAAEQRASEEIVSNVIPREYHDAVKHYFGRLQAKARAEEVPASAPSPASDTGGDQ